MEHAPGIAEHTRPGQFVALAVGGPDTALVLRRAFSIYRVSTRGVYGGTVEIVFDVTPLRAYSSASALVNPCMPAFAAE